MAELATSGVLGYLARHSGDPHPGTRIVVPEFWKLSEWEPWGHGAPCAFPERAVAGSSKTWGPRSSHLLEGPQGSSSAKLQSAPNAAGTNEAPLTCHETTAVLPLPLPHNTSGQPQPWMKTVAPLILVCVKLFGCFGFRSPSSEFSRFLPRRVCSWTSWRNDFNSGTSWVSGTPRVRAPGTPCTKGFYDNLIVTVTMNSAVAA